MKNWMVVAWNKLKCIWEGKRGWLKSQTGNLNRQIRKQSQEQSSGEHKTFKMAEKEKEISEREETQESAIRKTNKK